MTAGRGEAGPCESNVVIVDAERRQSVPLCAHRRTRYLHAYTSRTSSVRLYVDRQDHHSAHRAHVDPLFDIRKYTHLLQITGNWAYRAGTSVVQQRRMLDLQDVN